MQVNQNLVENLSHEYLEMQLKLLELCQQCENRGVTDKQLEDAMETKNPKSEVITLLLETFKVEAASNLSAQEDDVSADTDQDDD